ncbi:unnamed protein product [Symbiodinium sp. KB8]|nr:unnamed protein product [Symbiodinium sp. KB8]
MSMFVRSFTYADVGPFWQPVRPRYWLLHVEDRACVVPGQHPFDWDIVAQHIRDLFPNLRIPPTRPALGLQSQIFLPDYPLPEFASGPFFQFVPSRGPSGNGSEAGTDDGPSASASAATASANPPPTTTEGPAEVHSGVPSYPVSLLGWCLCFAWPGLVSSGLRLWCLLGQGILLPPICHGSFFTPPRPESEEEMDSGQLLESDDDDENLLGDTPDGLRPGDGLHTRPAGPPPPLPAGSPPLPDHYGANLIANASAPPDENYLPGDWATTQVPRSPLPALVIRHVQWRLAGFQQCLLTADVFQDFPVPTGTPFRFHNPFTHRPQCEELRYSVTQGGRPLKVTCTTVGGVLSSCLINPQPDSQAVHLIAMPHDWHLVSVALVAGLRIVPCCVPRRSRFSDLLAVPLEDIQGRLELPLQVELDHGTVTLRSGDCFRVAVRGDPPGPVEVEPIPSRIDAGPTEPAPAETSGHIPLGPSWSLFIPVAALASCPLRISVLLILLAWAAGYAMHRPGGFPWDTPPRDRVFQSPEIQGHIQVALHSHFLGSFPAYPAQQGTSHDTAWAQFLNDDTSWAVEFFPVWPGPRFNELTFVPVGADCATVTVLLRWRGHDRAVLIPRTVTIRWMQELAAAQVCTDVVDVSLPHPLEVWSAYDPVPCDFRLRNGDMIYLHEHSRHDPEVLVFEDSWDLQEGRASQHAPWAVGFRLDSAISVRLLRPGLRPYLATVPAGEVWDPLAFSFSGSFIHEQSGRWTPVQWTTALVPQLLLVSEAATLANIVVSTPEGRRVRAAPRFVARDDLAQALQLAPFPLTVGGVPDLTLDQGVELRNGDVIFGSSATTSGSHLSRPRPIWGVMGLLLLGRPPLRSRVVFVAAVFLWFHPNSVQGRGGDSSDDDLPSIDSDDARTVRSRFGVRSRSPARRLFPASARGAGYHSAIPVQLWDPTTPRGTGCFPDFVPEGGQVPLRILCPYFGWSEPRSVRHNLPWSFYENCGTAHCGRWATRFAPVGCVGRRGSLVLVPLCRDPFVTVLLHGQGPARSLVVPRHVTPTQFRHLTSGPDADPPSQCWISGPHAQMRAEQTHVQLRNGDHFGFAPDAGRTDVGRSDLQVHTSPAAAVSRACWSLPFAVQHSGVAWLWSRNSNRPEQLILRENTWWDPLACAFRDPQGLALPGPWIPALHGVTDGLHLLAPGGRLAVHVLCAEERDGVQVLFETCLSATLVAEPWEPSLRQPPSALRPLGAPTLALIGLALRGQGPVLWLLGLLLFSAPVSAMVEAPTYAFNAFHVGLFPWRRDPPDDALEDVSGGTQLETVYLSPCTGPCPALQFAPGTSIARWSEALLANEPRWGASACPVSSGAMIAVPAPNTNDVVCLHVTSHQVHYAVCVPRMCILPWLMRVLSTSASLDIISLAIPPGLASLEAEATEDLHWRTGDLVVALPPDAFTGLFQTPVFSLQAQVRHCAIWSLDFRVANRADVILWTPGHERPRLTKIPARARWSALASTFEGEFSLRYPGRWVPAPWVADDRPHLVLQPLHPERAHVIVEVGSHTFCADVRAATDAYRLWEDLPALEGQPTILSVPMPTLRAGTHVRTGDVIYVAEPSASARRGVGLGLSLFAMTGVAVTGRWSFFLLLTLCYMRVSSITGVRVAPVEVSHRLWDPAGPLLGPEQALPHSCPWALRRQLPAWSAFDLVRPSVHAGGPEWVPRAPDRDQVTVVLVCPPAPRAVLLPASCSSSQIRDLAAAFSPHAGHVAVHPAVRRVTLHGGRTIFSLRSGDVVVVRTETWVPMLRTPSTIVHATPQNAARDAFWGLPFRIQEPGMLFAWKPCEPRPLCIPTGRGELWDPAGCSFRPTLVAFSPDRWIPTQLLDPLGLHLVVASGDSDFVHLIRRGPPATVLREFRGVHDEEIRDGDVASAAASRPACLTSLLLFASCLCLPRPGGTVCAALSLSTCSTLFLPTGLHAPPLHSPLSSGLTTAQILFSTYASAWGAPVQHPNPPPIQLQDTAVVYALLSSHFLRKPLRQDLPAASPTPLRHAWHLFPVWHGGVPDEVFIATDGSGEGHGSWAFVAWALWRDQWYRIGWDCGSLHRTPWLSPAPVQSADTRSYLGELGALASAAARLGGTASWSTREQLPAESPSPWTTPPPCRLPLVMPMPLRPLLRCAGAYGRVPSLGSPQTSVTSRAISTRSPISWLVMPHTTRLLALPRTANSRLISPLVCTLLAAPCGCCPRPPKLVWACPDTSSTSAPELAFEDMTLKGPDLSAATASAPPPLPATSCLAKVVQANIQTIKDTDPSFFNREGHGQRRIYLARQLLTLDAHVALLQECRSRAGRWSSHGFLSWRSGHAKGQAGVEVWVRPDCVQPPLQLDHWRTCFSAPRLLIVRCTRPDFPVTLVSGHAPHAERPPDEIRAFWALLSTQLRSLRRDGPLVIGVDANADFLAQDEHSILIGPSLSVRQGRLADDFLLQLVQEIGLCAVGTWPDLHSGPMWTWQHTSGKRQRLDHILISSGTQVSRHRQFPEFDILDGAARDHMPLCCQVQIPGRACQDPRPSGRYAVDRASDVATAVWSSVTPRFDLSPPAQVSTFMRQHAAAVKALPRRPPFVKRQPYLSDEAAVILSDLRDARAELRTLQAALASSTLRAAFARWRDCTRPVDPEAQHQCLRLQIAHYQSVALSLRVRAHSLARRDKKQYFESLLTDAAAHWHATGRVQESANKLAWASKTARQKREVRAASGFDIDADLQAQFQQQEAGRIVTTEQLAAQFSAWQQHHRDACPLALPTLLDLEAMCRSQKRGKAPGPDQVRNEVWKCQPDQASRWLWPLCLRVSGGHPEPMHFKDSAVCALHKKGPAHLPVNFRSIAMLNGVAKLWHSHVRATVGQEILHRYFPTQLGGRKGVDTGLALAVFRCASDLADTAGRSWAAFFVDIQAAYYETDRDLLFHDASDDAALLQLQLPAHVHKLIAGGVLQGLGVPQSQIDLLRDCVECSFWTFTGQTQAVMASRGSRPGDGLADVLFGALFAVILNCLDHACQSEGICHTSLYEALGEAPRPLQIAWADDLSLLADFDSPQEAVELLPRLATVILRTIEAFRFRVNLGPGKTEALVKICGNGATAARARLLSDTAGIPTVDGRYVRLVPEYKYLGVPQRSNDSGRRDIEAAAGRGRAVWSQAANLVHSPSLPWPLKLAWFTGRTLPAAFSSLSTTVAVSARALSPLKGFYDQCLRQLATAWTDGHHVSSETLQICISAPDVDVSICVARVRLLCRLVQRRSDSAYAALVAAWDRAGRWAVLLQQAVRRPLNATPAQRLAAAEGRVCSARELEDELNRIAPGPSFASEARSANVIPRPASVTTPELAAPSSHQPSASSDVRLSALAAPALTIPSCTSVLEWRAFAEFAHPDDWIVPSVLWHAPQPPSVWIMPESWHRCFKLFRVISFGCPWSPGMWRGSSFLRREAAPPSSAGRHTSFQEASSVRMLFLRRLITFRLLLLQVDQGGLVLSHRSEVKSLLGVPPIVP